MRLRREGPAQFAPLRHGLAFSMLVLAMLVRTLPARADAEEASLHATVFSGMARLGDPLTEGTDSAALLGLDGRFTYATSDYFAYEAAIGLAQTGAVRYSGVSYGSDSGDLERTTRFVRASAGVTARLGVRFIPTLHVSIGGQARQLVSGRILVGGEGVSIVPNDSALSLIATGAVGFDYRVNRRLIVGASAGATHALGGPAFDAVEAGLHVAYYWYPRW